MQEIKILHTADIHLEWPFAGMGIDGHRGRLRREELKATFTRIIDLAMGEAVQVLLIAGDLFEHAHATRGLLKFIDEQFRRLGHTPVFISPGNHDPFLADSYYQTYPWAPNVHIFGPEVERMDLDHLGVSVYGWGFGAWEVPEYQLGGLRMADPGRINLVLMHGGDERYHPFRAPDLAALGADYIALGHIHKEGVLLEQGGRVIARYCGSPEPLSFGEPGVHGVYLGTVSKEANRLTFVPTARRQFITRDVDVTGAVSLEDLARMICQADEGDRRGQHCYRLVLVGEIDPQLRLDIPVLLDQLAGEFYFLKLVDQTRPGYDLERLAMEKSARGLFVQRLMALEAAELDEGQGQRIRRALALGLAAFEGRAAR